MTKTATGPCGHPLKTRRVPCGNRTWFGPCPCIRDEEYCPTCETGHRELSPVKDGLDMTAVIEESP